MKIAVLVYRLNGIGGIAKHLLLLSRELVDMGHTVDIYAVEYDPSRCYPELARGLNIQSFRAPQPLSGDMYRVPVGKRMLIYLVQLWQAYLDQQRLSAMLPEGYHIVNPHGDYVEWAAAVYKRRYGASTVWMCNDFWPPVGGSNSEAGGIEKLKAWVKKPLVYPFERHDCWAVRSMDRIVVLSTKVQAQMREHYDVASTVIRTGIVAPPIDLPQTETNPARQFQLLTVCALMPRRRIEDVLEALALLKAAKQKFHYTVVGQADHTPSYTSFLQSEVTRLDLEDCVSFTGEVSDKALITYFQACDAFVWPADEAQSWGMACMEAMACGKPVLVSRANGLAEVLHNEQDALLFDSRNLQQLADAILRIASDQPLWNRVATQGQNLVREQFSWRRNAESMLRVFSEAFQEHSLKNTLSAETALK
jgi:glycosyltransferase involved in cell wall biosynthesis